MKPHDHDGGQTQAWGVRDKPWQRSVTTVFFKSPTRANLISDYSHVFIFLNYWSFLLVKGLFFIWTIDLHMEIAKLVTLKSMRPIIQIILTNTQFNVCIRAHGHGYTTTLDLISAFCWIQSIIQVTVWRYRYARASGIAVQCRCM